MLQFTNIQLIALFSAKLKINAGLSKKITAAVQSTQRRLFFLDMINLLCSFYNFVNRDVF